ncbi:endonuclease [Neolewinella aurantiaca]|uniref:Endonuclease n=1 Tax=Neolewinella aurantiaca TaxID=2602767 RepID=A0A5C7FPU8_9BACT|nr:endonuclease/exonuclease/phosphatase family protein [Neolewinella aurantiaca]TXF89760.1 endonuclease [Neolewinella aurantiaca]
MGKGLNVTLIKATHLIVFRILAYLLGAFGMIGTLLPFLPYDDYWIRGFDYPRLQLIFVLAAATALWLLTNTDWDGYDYVIAGFMLACMTYQAYRILPYTPLWQKQSHDARQPDNPDSQLSIMVSNVLQTNTHYDKVVNLVLENDPDIFVSLESNHTWGEALHRGLDHEYPHHVDVPLENLYGMHVFSRIDLQNPTVKYRIKDDIPSVDATVTLGNGEEVDLYFLHPMPPSPTEDYASTGRDAELALVGLEVEEKRRNAIVAGDMNDVAWSHSSRLFQRLSGLLDPRRGRGLFATFHAKHWFMRWPLDHVFHSEDLAVIDLHRLGDVGSDHFPVFISFNFEKSKGPSQQHDRHDDDMEEAEEVINHGKNGKDDVLIPEEK